MPETPKGSSPEKGAMSPQDRAAFERRVSDLGTRIDSAQAHKKAEEDAQDKAANARGMAMGMRLSSEFVAAIVVGGLIGFGLDKWLGTTPWLFLLFFVLGLAAAILNVTRAFNRLQGEIERDAKGNMGNPVPDDDDE